MLNILFVGGHSADASTKSGLFACDEYAEAEYKTGSSTGYHVTNNDGHGASSTAGVYGYCSESTNGGSYGAPLRTYPSVAGLFGTVSSKSNTYDWIDTSSLNFFSLGQRRFYRFLSLGWRTFWRPERVWYI